MIRNKKLFAILTLVCFMFTLMPVAAFASDEEVFLQIAQGGSIVLQNDITTGTAIEITEDTTIDLNGYSIESEEDAFVIKSGTLTITDSSAEKTGSVIAGVKDDDSWCAVWANGGNVDIYGGNFTTGADALGNGNDTIYVGADGGTVTIYDGIFSTKVLSDSFSPDQYSILNIKDAARTNGTGHIIVYGGTFHSFNPANNSSEGPSTNFVATGYNVVENNGTYTVSPIVYTVTFNADNGSAVTTKDVDHGDVVVAPTAPTKDGFTFAGWYVDGEEYDFTAAVTGDLELTAKWTAIPTYTVIYTDGVDGEEIFADQKYEAVEENAATPAFEGIPTRDGYTFEGWSPAVAEKVTGNATYVATWTKNPVAVTGVTLDKTSATLVTGETVTLTATVKPADATNPDVTWSTSDATVAAVADGVVTAIGAGTATITVTTEDGDKTATCVVTVKAKHTVTFKNVENETKVEVISGEVVAAPEDPTLTGMTFEGWYSDAEYKTKYDFETPVTANITLHAKWKENSSAGGNGGGYVGGGSSSSSSSNKTESSTTTTVTPSGSTVKVETETKTESDGTKVETETTTTTTTTGETTKVETITETKTDGTVVETTTTTDSKGDITTVEKTTETNDEGTKVETTVTTDAQGETATTVTATLDNGSAVTNNDEAVKVEVTKVEETVVTKVEEAVAADETVEVVGTADNAVSVSATNSSTGAAQSNFVQPMSVNVPVDKAVLDNVTDTSKLTMAKVVTNEDGTTELVYMGGSYDEETGTFNAKVDEDGDYILVEKADLVKIELTIDDTTVKHNDNHHEMDVAPKINAEEGRTELPLRYLGEALGFGIDWNNNVVTITKGDISFDLTIGKEIPGFGTPYIDSDRTMVSARYISEMLGANVIWDPIDRQVIVVK